MGRTGQPENHPAHSGRLDQERALCQMRVDGLTGEEKGQREVNAEVEAAGISTVTAPTETSSAERTQAEEHTVSASPGS